MKTGSKLLAAVTGATTFLVAVSANAQSRGDYDHYGWGPHMMGWGGQGPGWAGMVFGPLMMVLMVALVVAVAVLMVRWLGGHTPTHTHHHTVAPSPVDILKERFARGEIDKDEFEERRRILED
jgi:putative membrane protein